MTPTQDEAHSLALPLSRIAALPPFNQISALLDFYRLVRPWLSGPRLGGMYEILEYDSTLELLDVKGETAIFRKLQRVKFLQDNIIAFQDYAWGDGDIFADYRCSPGIVVDRYQEGDRWNILISLRESKSKGDIENFYSERKVKRGFTGSEEWQQVEIRSATQQLHMNIIFPKQRRCQRALLLQRSRNRMIVLGPEHFHIYPDGRQLLSWETSKIRRFEIFTIRWWW
ncbi:hypothetical protein KC963_02675 [Candidatus Saccharibacteria bacterium]|nr:hypothetical protein [Candidatus Saccharibacteria bacterium]